MASSVSTIVRSDSTGITITGTSTAVALAVEIASPMGGPNPNPPAVNVPVTGVLWTASFPPATWTDFPSTAIECGKKIKVRLTELDSSQVPVAPPVVDGTRFLDCPVVSSCPVSITIVVRDVVTGAVVNPADILPPGDYEIEVTSPAGGGEIYSWQLDNNPPVSDDATFTVTLAANDTLSVVVSAQSPFPIGGQACLPVLSFVTLRSTAPPVCPEIAFDDIEPGDCINGLRPVSFNARVTATTGATVEAELVLTDSAGTSTRLDTGTDPQGQVRLTAQRDLDPGDYTLRINVTRPSGCPGAETKFTIEPCVAGPTSCPVIRFDALNQGACNAAGRDVTIRASVTLASGGAIQARMIDSLGTLYDDQTGNGTVTLLSQRTLGFGDHFVSVEVITPAGCPGATQIITVDPCDVPQPPPQTPPPPDRFFNLCTLWRFLVLLGAGFIALGSVISKCPEFLWAALLPDLGTLILLFFGIGLLLLLIGIVLWLIQPCYNACDATLLLAGSSFVGGIVFLYARGCSHCNSILFDPASPFPQDEPMFAVASNFFLGLGLVMFLIWLFNCESTMCRKIFELLLIATACTIMLIIAGALGGCVILHNFIWLIAFAFGIGLALFGLYMAIRSQRCQFGP